MHSKKLTKLLLWTSYHCCSYSAGASHRAVSYHTCIMVSVPCTCILICSLDQFACFCWYLLVQGVLGACSANLNRRNLFLETFSFCNPFCINNSFFICWSVYKVQHNGQRAGHIIITFVKHHQHKFIQQLLSINPPQNLHYFQTHPNPHLNPSPILAKFYPPSAGNFPNGFATTPHNSSVWRSAPLTDQNLHWDQRCLVPIAQGQLWLWYAGMLVFGRQILFCLICWVSYNHLWGCILKIYGRSAFASWRYHSCRWTTFCRAE